MKKKRNPLWKKRFALATLPAALDLSETVFEARYEEAGDFEALIAIRRAAMERGEVDTDLL